MNNFWFMEIGLILFISILYKIPIIYFVFLFSGEWKMGLAPVCLRFLYSDGRDLQYIVHIQFGGNQYRQVIIYANIQHTTFVQYNSVDKYRLVIIVKPLSKYFQKTKIVYTYNIQNNTLILTNNNMKIICTLYNTYCILLLFILFCL